MKIIIIGCGKVGLTLAELLSAEKHDVVLVDESSQKLSSIPEELDALRILGNGASVNIQQEAGVEEADLLIAVTGSDELNLLCCLFAKKAGVCHTIARVRNPIYNKEIGFIKEKLGISMIINPELTAATEISRLLRFPSAIKIDTFAKGRVELLKFRIKPEFHLNNMPVSQIGSHTNSDILMENAFSMGNHYKDSFGYVNRILPVSDLRASALPAYRHPFPQRSCRTGNLTATVTIVKSVPAE